MFMKYREKVGKLVAVDVECTGGKISSIRITGDFFLHPEEKIIQIEKSILGSDMDISENDLEKIISSELRSALLVGATSADLARIIRRALECGE